MELFLLYKTYLVYILFSEKLDRYYVGTTDEVERRLNEHNSGFYTGVFTSKGIPWRLCLSYNCKSSKKAYALERFIKRMKSRKFIEKLIDDKRLIDDIVGKL
ncbi:GIY-YIG nuclease family protein [Flavobacterium dankookense]|uniref:Putative endonuclease n=1 Tax=Flavobacterium dankookense TaxID=706186 RepID=A0A4R6Q6P0_9FLAO|nr:GIY-YIG nuclease family protein [Flavobacterium dankookense]TDP58154.1 putative endonuclease [Flavobacterium dankookense]